MIKNISDKLSKIKNDMVNSKAELSMKSDGDIFYRADSIYSDSSSDPINSEKEVKIQEYFNSKYFKINSKIKDIIFRLSDKSGDIKNFICDSTLDYSAVVSKYLYDGDFKMSLNDNREYFLTRDKNIYILTVKDNNCSTKIEFTKHSLIKIDENKNLELKTIIFRKQNLFQEILGINPNNIKKYEKIASFGAKSEEVYFSDHKKPERYVKYRAGKKEFEIIFDTSDWQYLANISDKSKVIPLEYYCYDFCENVIEKLSFQYAKPLKYMEYNSNTGKITKTFDIQGLNFAVSKYAFYNSLTGQMLAFGNL